MRTAPRSEFLISHHECFHLYSVYIDESEWTRNSITSFPLSTADDWMYSYMMCKYAILKKKSDQARWKFLETQEPETVLKSNSLFHGSLALLSVAFMNGPVSHPEQCAYCLTRVLKSRWKAQYVRTILSFDSIVKGENDQHFRLRKRHTFSCHVSSTSKHHHYHTSKCT